MDCYVHRLFEIRDEETGEWKAVKGKITPHFFDEDKQNDLVELETDLGYETYLSNIEDIDYLMDRGLPDDASADIREYIEEGVKREDRPFIEPSYITLSELAMLYRENRTKKIKDVYRNLMSKAYNIFNNKLDKLLMWASRGTSPKISKKEERMMFTGYDESNCAEYEMSSVIDELNDIRAELQYFYAVKTLVNNEWIKADDIRMVFYSTFM